MRPTSERGHSVPVPPVAAHRPVGDNFPVSQVASDPYLTLDALVPYSGLSRRTLQRYLTDLTDPIPHFKPGGKILVRRSEFDRWMERRRVSATADVAGLVNTVLGKVRGPELQK
jgi:predicted DNA-binding transcriptional regulator AlpA